MAIVKLKKLTFCGVLKDKNRVLEQLQSQGDLHLIPLNPLPLKLENKDEKQAALLLQALRYLNDCPRKRHQVTNDKHFNIDHVVEQVLKLKSKARELRDRLDALQKRIQELKPWGDFTLPENGLMSCQCFWFYIIPKRLMAKLKDCDYVWQTVYQNNLFSYVVVISEQEPPENALPVPRTHTGSLPLSTLQDQAGELEMALEDLQAQRESYTRWISLLTLHFTESQNHDELRQAQAITRDELGVFALQAWLPEKQVARYLQFADEQGLALLVEEPSESDTPPTLLENPAPFAGGEDLVNFYQTPDYQGWDPSLIVFFSFSLFFAIILSDAGYAGVFALILAWKWRSLNSKKGRRLRMLAASTIGLSVVWGVLCGSYFGYDPGSGNVLSRFKLFDLNDFDGMMHLTIAIGVLHIALANGVKAWQRRRSTLALAPIGWIGLVSGGFCLWLAQTQQSQSYLVAGKGLLISGAVLLILFSSDRRIRRWSDGFWRLLDGCKSLIGITQLFGDVLSYMRLFALGLASASLALTFNHLAEQVLRDMPGPGLLFSILILLLGHSLNLLLCILSGLVHGLRLNFIEFYNWSVSDEGYPFKAFSKKGVN
ncbi:V-type ATP synthase subunit I [Methylomonas methanica]|uniref:V-type ATPase 116 kDa subunit n=1 Tax=Methylomonas methanica (strain DSM 25384 / MC09) TaxID=857087 RepID=F9ZVV8_METMM|nr:ATPase [Methylomonas methanica]AEG00762.1 V-type ATPase 116 kDa subunit [Methylomonas methanica MC09]